MPLSIINKELNMNNHSFSAAQDINSYCEGIEARLEGTPRSENPYRDETFCSESWYEGWDAKDSDL
jgi:hypothetical protein